MGCMHACVYIWSAQLTIACLRARYGSELGFQGRSMRTIMTEAPQLALASFLSEICVGDEARCAQAHRTQITDEGRRC
jgi:hypothetical protein